VTPRRGAGRTRRAGEVVQPPRPAASRWPKRWRAETKGAPRRAHGAALARPTPERSGGRGSAGQAAACAAFGLAPISPSTVVTRAP
jgi:hypothetical protein